EYTMGTLTGPNCRPVLICDPGVSSVQDKSPAPVTFKEVKRSPNPNPPLFEMSDTFQMACRQLEAVAEHFDIDKGVLERLKKPKRAVVVSIPIRMDDGRTENFLGFRVQHSLTSGPSKG